MKPLNVWQLGLESRDTSNAKLWDNLEGLAIASSPRVMASRLVQQSYRSLVPLQEFTTCVVLSTKLQRDNAAGVTRVSEPAIDYFSSPTLHNRLSQADSASRDPGFFLLAILNDYISLSLEIDQIVLVEA